MIALARKCCMLGYVQQYSASTATGQLKSQVMHGRMSFVLHPSMPSGHHSLSPIFHNKPRNYALSSSQTPTPRGSSEARHTPSKLHELQLQYYHVVVVSASKRNRVFFARHRHVFRECWVANRCRVRQARGGM